MTQLVQDSTRLTRLWADVLRGTYPPFDFGVEIVPHHVPPAVLAFSGHHLILGVPLDLVPQVPPQDLSAYMSPAFLDKVATRVGKEPGAVDIVLCALAEDGPLPLDLEPRPVDHPRVQRAMRYRTDVQTWETPDGTGILTIGRGVGDRWEAGFEVVEDRRGRGLGRALARSARFLIPPCEGVFMQVAAGNVASLRAVLAAGFMPIGAEVLFGAREQPERTTW